MTLLHRWIVVFLGCWATASDIEQYYLYDDDCLDYHGTNYAAIAGAAAKEFQIIPFCRRDDFEGDETFVPDDRIPLVTFADLHAQNVSSFELYEHSVHLDLIEEYQAFRESRSALASNVSIYLCWQKERFGRYCQYSFYNDLRSFSSSESFDTRVKYTLSQARLNGRGMSCYTHLNCTLHHITRCLDWREICDAIVDCWPNPVDEQFCDQLELNECGPGEYRCFDGQCIPEIFLLDKTQVTDCVDQTDEDALASRRQIPQCHNTGDPSFRCADTKCYDGMYDSTARCPFRMCDNSGCDQFYRAKIDQYLFQLTANKHINPQCWAAMVCLLKLSQLISLVRQSIEPSGNAYVFILERNRS